MVDMTRTDVDARWVGGSGGSRDGVGYKSKRFEANMVLWKSNLSHFIGDISSLLRPFQQDGESPAGMEGGFASLVVRGCKSCDTTVVVHARIPSSGLAHSTYPRIGGFRLLQWLQQPKTCITRGTIVNSTKYC